MLLLVVSCTCASLHRVAVRAGFALLPRPSRRPALLLASLTAGKSPSLCRRPWPCDMAVVPDQSNRLYIPVRPVGHGPFIHLTKVYKLSSKLRINSKNIRSVLFECLGLNLQGKNINCCEMTFSSLLKI